MSEVAFILVLGEIDGIEQFLQEDEAELVLERRLYERDSPLPDVLNRP